MNTRHAWWIHLLVATCALLVLGAMTTLTRSVITAEMARGKMESESREKEKIRLALWRMDAAAAAWISDEAQRPVPSPGNREAEKPEVKLRFDVREDGIIVADDPDQIPALRKLLALLEASAYTRLRGEIPDVPASWNAPLPTPAPEKSHDGLKEKKSNINPKAALSKASSEQAYQKETDANEAANRGRALKAQVDNVQSAYAANLALSNVTSVGDWALIRASLPRPARIDGTLFLLRNLQWKTPAAALRKSVQGVWIDEPALKKSLLREIGDLFPTATLAARGATSSEGSALVSFPWKLVVPPPEESAFVLPPVIRFTLVAGWAAAIVAVLAAWTLVVGLLRLSERRASFVSAVTHELRTPLTTFQLYSDMLAEGTVREEKRDGYFRTLRTEARRLSHLVENVLAFSRIERGSARSTSSVHTTGKLIGPMIGRFETRLAEAAMTLSFDPAETSWTANVKTNAATMEHILFNLIDNAAKYSTGKTVRLSATEERNSVAISLTDDGPGIPATDRRKIFRPFHKSAAAAAETKPGVGLGLALSRRLARAAGGDLVYAPDQRGSSFTLVLPKA
ncbi:MAG: HAMP domain-containing sensor histidine kinase [Verrucomicrobiota bacterium]